MTKYRVTLPWNITDEDIERLRGLGEVEHTLIIEGESKRQVVRDLTYENMGWHPVLGNEEFWQDNLKADRRRT